MSRTDKDRPWWVAVIQDANYIQHDHRDGKCIEEIPEQARGGASRAQYRGHSTKCKKRVVIEFGCRPRKVDGRRKIVYDIDISDFRWVRNNSRKTCWALTCDHEHTPPWSIESYYCDEKYFVVCTGHYTIRYDSSISCICDEWPERPTCYIESTDPTRHRWFSGGVPSDFVRGVYHRPERTRERGLRDLAREYNTYGELEDGDFFNRQARNSARWNWW